MITQTRTLISPVAMARTPGPTQAVWFSLDLVLTLILEISLKEPSGSTYMLIFKNKLQLFVISSLTFILMDIGICP
jgi:hypothetical protein